MSETTTTIEIPSKKGLPRKWEELASAVPLAWLTKGSSAVLDQSVFSGSHFVLSLLLARWLPVSEYGIFALAYSILLFFLAIHSALLGEPLTVYGPARYRERFGDYSRGVLRAHWWLTLPGSVALIFGGYLLDAANGHLRWALWGVGFALPGVLLLWLVRRACYARLQPGRAVLASVAYSSLMIVLLLLLARFGLLSTFAAFAVMTVSAWVVSSTSLSSLRGKTQQAVPLPLATVIHDHWKYGSWAVVASGATWLTLNVYFFVLPATHGLETTAVLRALMNLVTPCLQAFVGIAMALVPFFARRKQMYGLAQMARDLQKALFLVLAASMLYAVLIWGGRDVLFSFLYAGKYGKEAGLPFLLLLLLPLAGTFPVVAGAGLRALERPDLVFAAYAGAVAALFLIGVPLARAHGILGAGAGLLLSESVAGGLCLLFLFRLRQRADA